MYISNVSVNELMFFLPFIHNGYTNANYFNY